MKQKTKKDAAQAAAQCAWRLLYEAGELLHAFEHLEHLDSDHLNVFVLQNIAAEKQSEAFEAISFVKDYFARKPAVKAAKTKTSA